MRSVTADQGLATSVLMFHGIGRGERAFEPDEETYWIDWPAFDEMVRLLSERNPQSYLVTFDDGNSSDLAAARRMAARGITGSFFVLVGKVGQPGFLTRENILEMQELGMEIGLHGRDHVDWRKTDAATLHSEIDLARDELSQLCGAEITSVAVPYGAYDRRIWRYLRRSSFSRIYTSDRGNSRAADRFVRRNPIMAWHAASDLADILRDKVPPTQRLRRTIMPFVKRNIAR